MLSYQHIYHAGNLADIHKHSVLSWVLSYLIRKDKPLAYIETHAGRGLYDLGSAEALKTAEAAAGIEAAGPRFADHVYGTVIERFRAAHGAKSYPGSPLIAQSLLRADDKIHLAELHPKERAALAQVLPTAQIYGQDGFALAHSLCPPFPRRGLILIDPSYEIKADYTAIPDHLIKLAKAWPVGIFLLWYPILQDQRHRPMCDKIISKFPEALRHEVGFAPARKGHGMVGSGLITINPPWGLKEACADIGARFEGL